jgi:hypothetical protein
MVFLSPIQRCCHQRLSGSLAVRLESFTPEDVL